LTPVTVTDKREQTFADLNMDGYPDLVIFDCAGVYVMMNAGGFKFNAPKLWNTDVKTCDKREKGLTDVDGDGLSDIYEFYDDKNVRIALNKNKKPKLIRVVDSFANEKTIKYGALYNNLYSSQPTIQITESMVTNGINFDVVTEFGSSDGAGGKTKIQYQYGNYYCNKTQGRSACSFSTIKYQNLNSSLFFVDDYYLEYPLTGSIKSKKSYLSNVMLYEKKFNYSVRANGSSGFVGAKIIYEVLLTSTRNDYFGTSGSFLKGGNFLNKSYFGLDFDVTLYILSS
jgi:hypothetical protein